MEEDFISFKLWKQINNTAIYISESGGCVTKNLRNGYHYPKIVLRNNPRGHNCYPQINLQTIYDGKKRVCPLYPHRAVALTYLPNHDIFKNQVDHLDGNIFNNHLWNLEWVTNDENQRRAKEARRLKKLRVESLEFREAD